jgi:hypothetical protein
MIRYEKRWERLLREEFKVLKYLWLIRAPHFTRMMIGFYRFLQDLRNWELFVWFMLRTEY